MIPALLPETRKVSTDSDQKGRQPWHFPPPYIPLISPTPGKKAATDGAKKETFEMIIGRREIIVAMSSSCGCMEEIVKNSKGNNCTAERIPSFRPNSDCPFCSASVVWIKRFISMQMLHIYAKEDCLDNTWSVEHIGTNEKVVFVDGRELKRGKDGIVRVGLGSKISFRNPACPLDIDDCLNRTEEKNENNIMSVTFTVGLVNQPLMVSAESIQEDCTPFLQEAIKYDHHGNVFLKSQNNMTPTSGDDHPGNIIANKGIDDVNQSICCNADAIQEMHSLKNKESTHEELSSSQSTDTLGHEKTSLLCHAQDDKLATNENHRATQNEQIQKDNAGDVIDLTSMKEDEESVMILGDHIHDVKSSQQQLQGSNENHRIDRHESVPKEPKEDVIEIDLVSTHGNSEEITCESTLQRNLNESSSHGAVGDEVTPEAVTMVTNRQTIFFLQRGHHMSKARIHVLVKSLQSKSDKVTVQVQFDKSNPPNYIVIDPTLPIETVQRELGFQDLDEMSKMLEKVHFVKPEWVIQYAAQSKPNIDDMVPTLSQSWSGASILHRKQEMSKDHEIGASFESTGIVKRHKVTHDSASVTYAPASMSIDQSMCHNDTAQARGDGRGAISRQMNPNKNQKLSNLFGTISKLYQECPLSSDDSWRSYSYNIVSKRLQYLDFEVTGVDCLKKLAGIKGFGPKILKQCKEFLTSGKCNIIREFEHDERRVAVRNMINIWGVGPAKAWELVDMGYKDIVAIRHGLAKNDIDLSAGARVGVQFYEDFQEKMTRHEVRMISKIVEEAVKKYFPTAEVMTMGSYRRGKLLCGDVDILITHREYTRTVPCGALDELVERLKSKGHISHHLTHVETKYFDDMPSRDEDFHTSIFPPFLGSQSYMGVFNSPYLQGKHRRIDIKFYPYEQKPFAMIYFTGDGYFNRSLRLFAKRHKGCRLNDHGLFPDHFGGRKSLKVKDEKEVFDKLGLVFKEPKDRDGFDAVVMKETNEVFFLGDVNKSDIESEESMASGFKWIE